jgi:hypothetical protein
VCTPEGRDRDGETHPGDDPDRDFATQTTRGPESIPTTWRARASKQSVKVTIAALAHDPLTRHRCPSCPEQRRNCYCPYDPNRVIAGASNSDETTGEVFQRYALHGAAGHYELADQRGTVTTKLKVMARRARSWVIPAMKASKSQGADTTLAVAAHAPSAERLPRY